ncbi:MAG: hypothetical protein QXR09_01035 [Candidatus Aenigmatarchaeota archaeon]
MIDWNIKKLEDFLERADSVETSMKFYEIRKEFEGSKPLFTIEAYVWLRTSLISWSNNFDSLEEAQNALQELLKHGFVEAKRRETRVVIK